MPSAILVHLVESASDLEEVVFVLRRTVLTLGSRLSPAKRSQVIDAAVTQLSLVERCRILVVAELVDVVRRATVQRRPVVARAVRTVHAVRDVAAQVREFRLAARLATRVDVVAEAVSSRHRTSDRREPRPMLACALVAVHASLAIAQVVQVLDASLVARWLRRLGLMWVSGMLAVVVDVLELAPAFGECGPLVAGTVIAMQADGVRAQLRKVLRTRLARRKHRRGWWWIARVLVYVAHTIDLVESASDLK